MVRMKETIAKQQEEILQLRQQQTINNIRVQLQDVKMDEMEQAGKSNQAVITGLTTKRDEEENKKTVVNFFKEKMKIEMKSTDMVSAHPINKDMTSMLVTFSNSSSRNSIFKAKKQLR